MKIIGVDLPRAASESPLENTLVLLGDDGRVVQTERAATLPEVAAAAGALAAGEPFLLGVNVPVVVPGKAARARPVENLVRRRFGFRLAPGGRSSLSSEPHGVAGEALMAGLAAAGQPCLPYPDRDRRRPGLAEIYPGLVLKALLWEKSPMTRSREAAERGELFRAYNAPSYRAARLPAKTGWAEQAVAVELVLEALGSVEGFDLAPAREALASATFGEAVEHAAALMDASLIAGMARRYLHAPETCLFAGDPETGYVILPADAFIRRLGSEVQPRHGRLFPQASLRERLGSDAKLRSVELLSVPGRPHTLEASFVNHPSYEFDNLDEMLWWKHTRHLAGPVLPTDGLQELVVTLTSEKHGEATQLRLQRSRHRTLSFRFEPPTSWRARVPTRDGKTYPFRVLRAMYDTLPNQS